MYQIKAREHIDKLFKKLSKKNPKQFKIIFKKLEQIVVDPYQYKPLKKPMQNKRRVHIDKSFVLIFSIDEISKSIVIEDYDHHDSAYK